MRASHQQGAALISVLLVFAIITILASEMITRSQADIERTRWLITEAQAYQYALGGEALARQILWQQQSELASAGINISPIPYLLQKYDPDHGQMAIEIVDLQGLINLNNANEELSKQTALKRLFTDALSRPELMPLLADWIDTDTTPRAGGAEDFAYQGLASPYRTGNQVLSHASELMLLQDFPTEKFETIKPIIINIAAGAAININTAPAEVFSLLNPSLSGQQIVTDREQKPYGFQSVDEFMTSHITAGLEIDNALLTVTSTHYGVKIIATVDDRALSLFSRLTLSPEGKIQLQQRTIGETFIIKTLETDNTDQDDQTTNSLL